MTTVSNTTRQESLFGIIQVFTLGVVLVIGAILAVLLYRINIGGDRLALMASHAIRPGTFTAFAPVLWGIEVCLYLIISWRVANRPLVLMFGVVMGTIFRFIISFILAALINALIHQTFPQTLQELDTKLCIYRVLAIAITAVLLLLPCRRLLETGFGLLDASTDSKKELKTKQFSFAAKAASSSGTKYPIRQTATTAKNTNYLTPPETLVSIYALEDVYGTVTLPVQVVLDSIQEVQSFLKTGSSIRVRLAYIVPQLRTGTVWLKWQHIFGNKANDQSLTDPNDHDAALQDRWIRIPPKLYVPQVPREYFHTTKTPPAWLKLPEVPQENEFQFKE